MRTEHPGPCPVTVLLEAPTRFLTLQDPKLSMDLAAEPVPWQVTPSAAGDLSLSATVESAARCARRRYCVRRAFARAEVAVQEETPERRAAYESLARVLDGRRVTIVQRAPVTEGTSGAVDIEVELPDLAGGANLEPLTLTVEVLEPHSGKPETLDVGAGTARYVFDQIVAARTPDDTSIRFAITVTGTWRGTPVNVTRTETRTIDVRGIPWWRQLLNWAPAIAAIVGIPSSLFALYRKMRKPRQGASEDQNDEE